MEPSRGSSSPLAGSDSNEFEIIEFIVSGQSFGVNVSKVKQIIQFDEKLRVQAPKAHPYVAGLFQFRGASVTLIDLRKALNLAAADSAAPLVLVTEFNNEITAFLIDGVTRIHRVSWDQIQPINGFLENFVSSFTGSISLDGREALIVDLEQIVAEINPENDLRTRLECRPPAQKPAGDPAKIKIALAEDSSFMRKSMVDAISREGFTVAGAFDNGLSALEFVKDAAAKASAEGKTLEESLDVLITDIEMPKMDGITLAKNIRALGFNKLQIVVFSSIVNKQMTEKAKSAGVDRFISKPKLEELRDLILGFARA